MDKVGNQLKLESTKFGIFDVKIKVYLENYPLTVAENTFSIEVADCTDFSIKPVDDSLATSIV